MRIETKWSDAPVDLGAIGRTGENAARVIEFDCTDALSEYPDASILCAIRRPCDSIAYLGSLTADGKKRTLTLTAAECAVKGRLHMELRVVDGDTVLKTATYTGWIEEALTGSADKPGNPVADVLNRLDGAVEKAESAAKAAQGIAETVQTKLENGELNGAKGDKGDPVDVQVDGVSMLKDGVATIPLAGYNRLGVVQLDPAGFAAASVEGKLALVPPTDDQISTHTHTQRPITPSCMDYTVKAAMCDGKGAAWTEAEQKAARERMGADGNYVLIEKTVLTEETSQFERAQEPDGTPYNLAAIKVVVKFVPGQMKGAFFCYGKNSGVRIIGGASQTLAMPSLSGSADFRSVAIFDAKPEYGGFYNCETAVGSQGSAMPITRSSGGAYTMTETSKKIQSIAFYLYFDTVVQMIAGTEIAIYGVRA